MNAKRTNKAISLGVSVIIVIALIIIVGFGVYLNATLNPTLNTTYTKATDITVIPSPPFTPSVVCTNTTAIQDTTLTCTAIATSSSSSSSLTTSTSSVSTICTILESSPLILTVKNSSSDGQIASLPIQISEIKDVDCNQSNVTNLGIMSTNSSGMISLCCTATEFFFNTTYSGVNYSLNVTANGAESAECLTWYIPSLKTTTTYSPNFDFEC